MIIVLKNKKRNCIVILGIILLLYHSLMFPARDDLFYMHTLDDTSLWAFLVDRYNSWSSRIVSECLGAMLLSLPTIVWKSLDVIIWIVIYVLLIKFCDRNCTDNSYEIILCLVLLYPFEHMGTAGWAITNIFYSWPLMFTLMVAIILKSLFYGKEITLLEKVICVISTFVCGTTEQSWVVMTFLCVGLIAYNFFYKRRQIFPWVILIINLFDLVIILSSPGSRHRMFIESGKYMPDFFTLTFVDKISAGVISTMSALILDFDFLFFIFCIAVAFNVSCKVKNIYLQVMSYVPSAFCIIGLFYSSFERSFPQMMWMLNGNLVDANNCEYFYSYIPLLIYIWIICILVISICMVFDDKKERWLNIFILGAGFASRITMGFSPTLFASAERTFIFAYFSLIISIFWLYKNLKEKNLQIFLHKIMIMGVFFMVFYQLSSIELYR